MLFAKLVLLIQIHRIFTIAEKNFIFWATWILIICNVMTYISATFVYLFGCSPREAIWNPRVSGKCINWDRAQILTSAMNVVSDFCILVLPLQGIWGLHMPLKRKLGAGSVFGVGILYVDSEISPSVWQI